MTTTPPAGAAVPGRVVALAWIVLGQGALMLLYAAATVVLALTSDANAGAVAFVVTTLVLWGLGLVFVSRRGLLGARRWAFSPTMFTQAVFGLIAIADLRASGNPVPATVAWLVVLVSAVTALWLLFSAEVRHTLVPPSV